MKEPIRKLTLADGRTRYRLVVDIGLDESGRRLQRTSTHDLMKDARAELARIRNEINAGTYVKESKLTLNEYLDEYLVGATRELRASTKRSYQGAFRCPRERLGERPIQSISKPDIERLVEYMETTARKRSGPPGTGLGARSIRLTLGRLSAAFEMAMLEGLLARNVVRLVEPPTYKRRKPATWNEADVQTFLDLAARDRLHAVWRVSMYGLRRGEVMGLRWSDIDLRAKTLSVRQARLCINNEIRIEAPKSDNGIRTLPMDDELVAALKDLHRQQSEERLRAGSGYARYVKDLDWYVPGDAYLAVDASGYPTHPEWYSDEFLRMARQAGLARIRLHDSRHTALSLMEKSGVPISIISKWAGHCDPSFTYRTYVHANDDDLKVAARSIGKLHKRAKRKAA